ncbi:flagellar basal body P-ring formation chaperone FlgA [Variovorax sp. J22P168]|uniref:flagellar basal body P-ring formation chaperone FlgA n=1 Tax=Variovorax jilinensis TaxID=3053513 RepID=UPI002574F0FB|nr:flagellar basal body P-ring formation chaperone FlgA [Variovorax sp. J22P168]MDM0014746.1 flagellar basal body P-ring formation chaperone FlgA [Variovorax sp. J22P168]
MAPPFSFLRRQWPALALLIASLAGGARAQQAPSQGTEVAPGFVAATQQWLDDAVARSQSASALPLRMEVSVGALDSRLRLAPCGHVEPYVPVGLRLWGRTRLGLRCTDGSVRWNVFLPVTVKAWGPAWVLRDNVVAGTVLTAADAVEAEADWAADPSPVVADPGQWVGQTASRSLAAGQPLRQSMVKPAQVFPAGAQVRVVAQGAGFEVSADAQALTPGVVGQPVRLRMDSGRMTTGVVQDGRTVRLAM